MQRTIYVGIWYELYQIGVLKYVKAHTYTREFILGCENLLDLVKESLTTPKNIYLISCFHERIGLQCPLKKKKELFIFFLSTWIIRPQYDNKNIIYFLYIDRNITFKVANLNENVIIIFLSLNRIII